MECDLIQKIRFLTINHAKYINQLILADFWYVICWLYKPINHVIFRYVICTILGTGFTQNNIHSVLTSAQLQRFQQSIAIYVA
jgi:hypothetical protein